MMTAANSSDSTSQPPANPKFLANLPHSDISNPSIMSIGSISIANVAGMVPTKLNRQNYITWRNLFIFVLKRFKLLGLINGEDLCPPKFIQTIQKGDSSMTNFLNFIKDISDKLAIAGKPLTESDLVAYILSGLQDEYESFVDFIETRNEVVIANELHSLLLSKEISLQKCKNQSLFLICCTISCLYCSIRQFWRYLEQRQLEQQQFLKSKSKSF
ncbi:unnamed protein product [Malus baccata var. baccata]